MKQATVKLGVCITVICVFSLLSGCVFGASSDDDFGPEYETVWKSTDGHFELTNNNKLGMSGMGTYDGIYYVNGKSYPISIKVNGYQYSAYSEARFDIMELKCVYAGEAEYDWIRNTYTVYVDKADDELSVYKPGDKIVFYQVDE